MRKNSKFGQHNHKSYWSNGKIPLTTNIDPVYKAALVEYCKKHQITLTQLLNEWIAEHCEAEIKAMSTEAMTQIMANVKRVLGSDGKTETEIPTIKMP